MRRLKATLSWMLVISMVISMMVMGVPSVHAATTPQSSITTESLGDRTYKMIVHLDWDQPVKLFQQVLSYDSNLIEPIDAYSHESITIENLGNTDLCFETLGCYSAGRKYGTLAAMWRIDSENGRVGFASSVATNQTPTYAQSQDMFAFYFKLKDGVQESDLYKGAIRFETDTKEGSMLALLYNDPEGRKNSIRIDDKDSKNLKYGDNQIEFGGLSYPNSTVAKLDSMVLSLSPESVTVGKESQTITANISGKDAEGDDYTPTDVTYSIPTTTGVTIDAKTGVVTVTKDAQSGTVTVTAHSATAGVEDATAALTITRPEAALTTVELDKSEVTVNGTGDAQIITAAASDQFGTVIANGVNWSIQDNADANNVTIDQQGKVSVLKLAKAGTYTVKAVVGNVEKTVAFTVKRAASSAATVTVSGGQNEVLVPAVGAQAVTTTAFTVEVKDQYGDAMEKPTVTWSIPNAPTSVTIGNNGVVTVTDAAKEAITDITGKTYKVTATCGAVSGTADLAVKRAEAKAAKVIIYRGETALSGADTVVMPVAGGNTKEYTYTAKLFDQYDGAMNGDPTWSSATISDPTGVSFTNGKLTVENTAPKGTTVKFTAGIASVTSAELTVTITDLDVVWTGVETKNITYGDKNSAAITLPASGTAQAGDVTVTGTFSVKDADTIQPVGNGTVKVTVIFTADDKTTEYKGVKVEKDFEVTIAKRPVTVTMDSKSRAYGEANPELTYKLTSGTLVGEDTNVALALTPACTAATTSPAGTPVDITATKGESANYDVTVVNGTLTITKANITGFQTAAPTGEILANNEKNTTAAAVKGAIVLPETVTITFKDGTADLPIVWGNAAEDYHIKGGAYTYKGTVTAGANFNAYTPTLDAKLTVKPVTGTISQVDGAASTAVKTPVVVAKAKAAGASDYTALKLPGSITLSFDNGVTSATYDSLAWSVPLDTLKNAAVGSKTSVTLTSLPEWITIAPIAVEVQITDKYPVDVTVQAPADVTYGTALGNPVPTQVADEDGVDSTDKFTWTYLYTGTTAAGKAYSSADKPIEAGTYTVKATLVSDTHAGSGTSAEFKITPKTIKDAVVTLTDTIVKFVYNTKPFTPAVTVKDGETTLVKDTDYAVEYTNNTNAGNATITVTGKGNYDDKTTVVGHFAIAKASIAEMVPVITGTGKVGEVLSASLKDVAVGELDFQWKRGTENIGGATESAYVVSSSDSGAAITVVITAKDPGNYTGTAKASNTVTVEKLAISGNVVITSGAAETIAANTVLTADVQNVRPAAARGTLAFQWSKGGAPIAEANENTYTVTADDVTAEASITVTVTADGKQFTGALTSAPVVAGKKPLPVTGLSIAPAGEAAVGTELTASFTSTPALTFGTDYTLTWLRDGVEIPGATAATYTVTKADLGLGIMVKATAAGTYTGAALSSNTIPVPPVVPDAPVVSASAGNGQVTVSWTAPANNGAPITGYAVQMGENAPITLNPNVLSYVFTELTNDTAYTFTVTAVNSKGPSAPGSATATPTAPSTPSGGGSSGGGGTTPPPAGDVNTSGDTTTVVTEVKSTVSGGTASATVSEKTVKNAIDQAVKAADKADTTAAVEFKVKVPASADTVKASLPASALKAVADSDVESLAITSNLGQVVMDSDTAASIAKQAGSGNVSVTLGQVDKDKDLNPRQREVVGDAAVYDISIKSGSKQITSFDDGEITISLPYTLKEGEDPSGLVVYYLDDEGNLQKMDAVYDAKTKLISFTVSHLSLYMIMYEPAAAWQSPFTDVKEGDWFYEAVRYAAMNGLFSGTSESTFSPSAPMTRAMTVTVLWRSAGQPAGSPAAGFTDVASGTWYSAAVDWAAAQNVVSGVGDGLFAPEANVSREQLAAILYRYAGSPAVSGADLTAYVDGADVSDWARDAILWAVKEGILTGQSGNLLAPGATATRAEVATILQRFVEYSLK